jgi:hypothetical protein
MAVAGFSASKADTTETTETTTVTSNSAVLNLPATGTYVVVDPITGAIQGNYDPIGRLVNGNRLQGGVVIVDQTNGGLVATVDSMGNIVDVGVAPASPTLVVSIDARRKDLNLRIEDALNKGLLTAQQAESFRTELNQIAADEDASRVNAGIISYRKALILGYGLNTLSERLMPITHTVSFEPVIAPEFVSVNGSLTLLDEITYRKQRMTRRIDDEYAAGRLSSDQVSKLKDELNRISSAETRSIRDGALSTSKDRKVSEQLDQLQTRMDRDVAFINEKRSKMGIRVN